MQRRDMIKLTSSLLAGTAMTLTITQGGYQASASTPAWGQGGQQTISITAHRTEHEVAPDSVRFEVNLTQADFDTPEAHAPTDNYYKPRLHELIYLWDFDTTGVDDTDYSPCGLPTNLPAFYKKRRYGKGPEPMHCYRVPGTYSVSVLVYEPSSGKWGTATLDGANAITVKSPEEVYTKVVLVGNTQPVVEGVDAETLPAWVVAGGYNLEGSGGKTLVLKTASGSTSAYSEGQSGPGTAWLFRRGDTFYMDYYAHHDKVFLSDFGSSEDDPPRFAPTEAYNRASRIRNKSAKEIRVSNLWLNNSYDSTAMNMEYYANYWADVPENEDSYQFEINAGTSIFHNVEVTGTKQVTFYLQTQNEAVEKAYCHLNECSFSDWGNYLIYTANRPADIGDCFALTGTRLVDHADAVSQHYNPAGSPVFSYHSGSIRIIGVNLVYISQIDVFQKFDLQPCIKLHERSDPAKDEVSPFRGNLHERNYVYDSVIEGGTSAVNVAGSPYQSDTGYYYKLYNSIVDGCLCIGTYSWLECFQVGSMGATVRNNYCILPDTLAIKTSEMEYVLKSNYPGGSTTLSPPEAVLTTAGFTVEDWPGGEAPSRFENNTILIQRQRAKNIAGSNGITTLALKYIIKYENASEVLDFIEFSNNVIRFEDADMVPPDGSQGPALASTPVIPGVASRNTEGFTTFVWGTPPDYPDYSVSTDPDYITPSGSIWPGTVTDGAATRTGGGAIGPACMEDWSGWFSAGAPADRDTVGALQ